MMSRSGTTLLLVMNNVNGSEVVNAINIFMGGSAFRMSSVHHMQA
jgi:hypothetical protein